MIEQYEYDNCNRMKYNPEFHFSHGKPFSASDLEYICKFHEVDGPRKVGFAIGKTEQTVSAKLNELKKKGLYQFYKNSNRYW